MVSGWTIFWLTKCTAINTILAVAGVLIALYAVGYWWTATDEDNNIRPELGEEGTAKRYFKAKLMLITAVLLILLALILPSTKEAFAIYTIPKIVNNKGITKVPAKLLDYLDVQIDTMRKEAGK